MYNVIQINDFSWRIEDGVVRMFLFVGEDKALLVDTGFGSGNVRQCVEGITDKPIILVNTHGDNDHTGCNKFFDEIYMHPSEFAYYQQLSGCETPPLPIYENDVIDLGGLAFEVILLPGHTPGSIALLDRKNKVLVGGDSVSTSSVFIFGQGRSLAAFMESMKKLQKLKSDFDTVYPSHGEFGISGDIVDELILAAEALRDGKIPPQEPPMNIPAKMYRMGKVGFYY
ncbi:MAG: MBL fold metallo-hydrolase [Oscillospiraceae bacterium]|nr:MBL fold metallo-hydrolase [Oscillospiraceae bacterium]